MADAIDPPSGSVSEAINRLGLSLLQSLAKESEGNVFISPFSLSTALAMLHCGARGDTRREMRQVFGYEDSRLSDDEVSSAFSCLLSSLEKSPDSYVLSCANSLVIQKDFSVKDEYKKLLQESFRASLFEADFEKESEKAVKDINQWVEGKTNGMIPQLLDKLNATTVMVLLNAIYFKGTWVNKFEERSTRLQNFYNGGLEQNAKQVQMMHQKDRFGFAERKSFTALQLPYVGKEVVMMVLLPRFIDGLKELEKQLTPELLKQLQKEMRQKKVNVALPKFRFEYSKSMKGTLQELGLIRAFVVGADLGGMSNSNGLRVSDVVHKAVVEVNEEGSEAAAATAVVIEYRCLVIEDVPDFIVDHPFLFTILDTKNNTVLFMGRINEL